MIRHNGIEIDKVLYTISHLGKTCEFAFRTKPNKRFDTVCHLILGGGISKEQLFYRLYGNDSSGGPLQCEKSLQTLLAHIARVHLPRVDLKLTSWWLNSASLYEIVPLAAAQHRNRFSRRPGDPRQRLHQAGTLEVSYD